MYIFIGIISLLFFFVSHMLYMNILLPYIDGKILNIVAYLMLFFTGQSFVLLFKHKINKILEYFIYIVIFVFSFMFFYYIIMAPLRMFYFYSNTHIVDLKVLIFAIVLAIIGLFNIYNLKTTIYKLKSDKNISLKIAFISDLHIGDPGINSVIFNKMINTINGQDVDLVLFGGDIIEKNLDVFNNDNYGELFKKIKSKYGAYGVLGNHEYYGGMPYKISETIKNKGNVKILNDEAIVFDNFVLMGREDKTKEYFGSARKSIQQIYSNQDDIYKILLDHNPKYFDESVKNNIDLQLSGHTHNGQFFPYNIIVKFFYEKAYGKLVKDNSTLIVSSGLSGWRIPIKLFSKSEVVIVCINRPAAK